MSIDACNIGKLPSPKGWRLTKMPSKHSHTQSATTFGRQVSIRLEVANAAVVGAYAWPSRHRCTHCPICICNVRTRAAGSQYAADVGVQQRTRILAHYMSMFMLTAPESFLTPPRDTVSPAGSRHTSWITVLSVTKDNGSKC